MYRHFKGFFEKLGTCGVSWFEGKGGGVLGEEKCRVGVRKEKKERRKHDAPVLRKMQRIKLATF